MKSDSLNIPQNVLVMGILNVTPDSFSDGGHYLDPEKALDYALQMQEEGADWIDLGAESTRPGAVDLSLEEEMRRLSPVLQKLAGRVKRPLSIDTRKAAIARMAMEKGASLLNDVSGFSFDAAMVPFLQKNPIQAVLMHSRGNPRTMKGLTQYGSVVDELIVFFEKRLKDLEERGIARERFWIDPGIGFAKDPPQNVEILSQLRRFQPLQRPLLIGLSRKSFLAEYFGPSHPEERGQATEIAHTLAILNGANILRVHDVAAAKRTIKFVSSIMELGREYRS